MTADRNRARLEEGHRLVAAIRPLLAGASPESQGVALAELTSIWVSGFHSPEGEAESRRVRGELMANQDRLVRTLVSIATAGTEEVEVEIEWSQDDDDDDDDPEDEPEDDGQPTEMEEWRDYDPEC